LAALCIKMKHNQLWYNAMVEHAAVSPNMNVDCYLSVNSFYVILNHLKHSECYTSRVSSFTLMKICILLTERINAFI